MEHAEQTASFTDSDRQVFYKLDLTSPSATQSVCNKIKAEHGSPTVLINNAGLGTGHDILSETTESLELVFNLNLFAHYRLVQEFLPAMIASNHGHIVNIASMASFSTVVRNVAYSATKAAVLAFSEGLRQELRWVYGGSRIRITYALMISFCLCRYGNRELIVMQQIRTPNMDTNTPDLTTHSPRRLERADSGTRICREGGCTTCCRRKERSALPTCLVRVPGSYAWLPGLDSGKDS